MQLPGFLVELWIPIRHLDVLPGVTDDGVRKDLVTQHLFEVLHGARAQHSVWKLVDANSMHQQQCEVLVLHTQAHTGGVVFHRLNVLVLLTHFAEPVDAARMLVRVPVTEQLVQLVCELQEDHLLMISLC